MATYPYKRADGSTWYRIEKSHRGQRLMRRGFRARKTAEAYERKWIDSIDAGLSGTAIETTLEAFTGWWLEHKTDLKPSTLANYRSILGGYVDDIGWVKMHEVTPPLLQDLLSRVDNPKTRLNHIALLRVMFKEAKMYGYVITNPVDSIPKPKTRKKEMNYLSPEEVTKLLDASEGKARLLIELAVLTGMRRGELFGLKWKDITDGHVNVKRARFRKEEISPKSSHAVRKIPIGEDLKEHLQAYQGEPEEYVFDFDPDNFVKRDFASVLRKAGVRRVRFHDLRHTFATLMISRGVNPKYLQRVMGHENFSTTMDTYGHLYPEESDHLVRGLQDLRPVAQSVPPSISSQEQSEQNGEEAGE